MIRSASPNTYHCTGTYWKVLASCITEKTIILRKDYKSVPKDSTNPKVVTPAADEGRQASKLFRNYRWHMRVIYIMAFNMVWWRVHAGNVQRNTIKVIHEVKISLQVVRAPCLPPRGWITGTTCYLSLVYVTLHDITLSSSSWLPSSSSYSTTNTKTKRKNDSNKLNSFCLFSFVTETQSPGRQQYLIRSGGAYSIFLWQHRVGRETVMLVTVIFLLVLCDILRQFQENIATSLNIISTE